MVNSWRLVHRLDELGIAMQWLHDISSSLHDSTGLVMSYPTGYLAILELKKMTIGFSESGKTFGPSVLFTLNL